jgi:hypothetical protein
MLNPGTRIAGTYGHVEKLARALKEGVDSVEGVEGVLYQVRSGDAAPVVALHLPPHGHTHLDLQQHTLSGHNREVLTSINTNSGSCPLHPWSTFA